VTRAVRSAAWTIATWFGCGLAPRAPGTMGSLGAVPLYLLAAQWGRPGVGAAAALVTAVGVWAATVVVRELKTPDPQVIVVDEVAGMLVTMMPMREFSWRALAFGFVLFRLFDVVKPWPARALERLPSGWGVVMDDIAAGVFGAMALVGLRAAGVLP
jgi:phosphatidylglycerophosphatase A